jgi:glucose/arabinose dehydrogenase
MLIPLLSGGPAAAGGISTRIQLPPGFRIDLYADKVPDARSLALSPSGVLFVGTRKAGNVYAVLDRDGDGRAEEVLTVARGLDMPNGVALRGEDLYVAEMHRVVRFRDIEARLTDPGAPETVSDGFPAERWHGWKFIRFGPDGRLYLPVGAPCNVCQEQDPRFAAILRMSPDGSGLEIFARGVRNTVGFDWHPGTGELWFTDNGRDFLGDDQPPDELNRAERPGLFFGFPHLHGNSLRDPVFGDPPPPAFRPPEQELGPHVAALGMRFYTGAMFPPEYRNQIFIAEHGSWNRSQPIGYRVSLVRLAGGRAVSYEVFAQGWLEGRTVHGRPVDLEPMPDGSLLLSDDHAGRIYRISYRAP